MEITKVQSLQGKDFISIANLSKEEFEGLVFSGLELKNNFKKDQPLSYLSGKSLAMIFEKPSLRTRTTFDIAMYQLGGHSVYLSQQEVGLGVREAIKDIAFNLERWVNGIVVRTFVHEEVIKLAEHSNVPVINGLTDFLHPCQLLADYITLQEHFGELSGLNLVFVGDGNNVANSHINAAMHAGVNLTIACPEGFEPSEDTLKQALAKGAKINVSHNPKEAIKGADALYTDVWISMGQEKETRRRKKAFQGYTITPQWFKELAPKGVFMHDLPAHYGEECTEDCIYHERSVVFEQAENRLHAHKAILYQILG